MRNRAIAVFFRLLLSSLFGALGCHDPNQVSKAEVVEFGQPMIVVEGTGVHHDLIRALAMDANHLIATRLQEEPLMHVQLQTGLSREVFDELVRTWLGFTWHRSPSRATLVAVAGKNRIALLDPEAYGTDSSLVYNAQNFKTTIEHEFVHLFHSRHDAQSYTCLPEFIEGPAVWLSGQWKKDKAIRTKAISVLVPENIPSLRALKKSPGASYYFGWLQTRYRLERSTIQSVWKRCREPVHSDRFDVWLERHRTEVLDSLQ